VPKIDDPAELLAHLRGAINGKAHWVFVTDTEAGATVAGAMLRSKATTTVVAVSARADKTRGAGHTEPVRFAA
jgi:hypothetical protein